MTSKPWEHSLIRLELKIKTEIEDAFTAQEDYDRELGKLSPEERRKHLTAATEHFRNTIQRVKELGERLQLLQQHTDSDARH